MVMPSTGTVSRCEATSTVSIGLVAVTVPSTLSREPWPSNVASTRKRFK
jgi:hypothetical protein